MKKHKRVRRDSELPQGIAKLRDSKNRRRLKLRCLIVAFGPLQEGDRLETEAAEPPVCPWLSCPFSLKLRKPFAI